MLNMQNSIVVRCRARFNSARFICRGIAAKEISADCWVEASILSMHIDRPVSAIFVSGFISWNPSRFVSISLAFAVKEA